MKPVIRSATIFSYYVILYFLLGFLPLDQVRATDSDMFACLSGDRVIVELTTGGSAGPDRLVTTGLFRSSQSLGDRVAIDSRHHTWTPELDARSYIALLQISHTASDLCWAGGLIHGTIDIMAPGYTIGQPAIFDNFILEGIHIDTFPVGIHVSSESRQITITESWLSSISQRCVFVENDHGGMIEDSLLEGCPNPISLSESQQSLSGQPWILKNNLFDLTGGGSAAVGSGPVPSVELYDNKFAIDEAAVEYMRHLSESAAVCDGNVIIWLGQEEHPSNLGDCFIADSNQNAWNEERSIWIQSHSYLRRVDDASSDGGDGTDDDGSAGDEGGDDQICFDGDCSNADDGKPWADGTYWSDGTGWIE